MRLTASAVLLLVGVGCFTPPYEGGPDSGTGGGTGGSTGGGAGGSGTGGGVASVAKPKVMLLIDRSGSMNFPNAAGDPQCSANCNNGGPACPPGCATRISVLRSGMQTFLGAHGDLGWLGVATYPTSTVANGACTSTQSGDVGVELATDPSDSPTSMNAVAQSVNARIQALVPAGGTPTAGSLRFLANYAPLTSASNRNAFVVLITDGLPNCNESNPNTCTNSSACKCTLANCTGAFCAMGCLDQNSSVAAIEELRTKNVRTVVIGFGADALTGDGPEVLSQMAAAGGMGRACPNGVGSECGTGGCEVSTKLCKRTFYPASNAAELVTQLERLISNP
jgi:hypothetical protein